MLLLPVFVLVVAAEVAEVTILERKLESTVIAAADVEEFMEVLLVGVVFELLKSSLILFEFEGSACSDDDVDGVDLVKIRFFR